MKRLLAALLVLAGVIVAVGPAASGGTARSASPSCGAPLPLLSAPSTSVLVTVVAPSVAAVQATVSLYRREGTCFVRTASSPGWIGAAGLSPHHHEGDRTTPTGLFSFGATMYGVAADPGLPAPYHRLVCGDWWDEDPASATYNRFVHLSCGATPSFGGGSEALWRIVPAYDEFAAINYNPAPAVPGRGSAIFLHRSTGQPTVGCVSLPESSLLTVLRALRPGAHPLIAIGTAKSIATLRSPTAL